MRTLTFQRVIGSGAMGTVYLAELRAPGGFRRTCAVKVMTSTNPDHDHFLMRMRDEARLLGMLQDEQVLGVSELVMVDGRDAVVMEYVEGADLGDITEQGPVPPRALAELGAEIAGTLHRAHVACHPTTHEPLNVVHRDIKPANIMVTSRGGVRLLDFGVARAAFASRESQTRGLVLGTLNYFPPEVLAGADPTQAADIYGLGLTLWEAATGRRWGAPKVQQAQFERRVDQRLEDIAEEHRAILPVLRQALQWDPLLRPDGGVLERSLLHAADEAKGQGLRTWARQALPGLLQARDKKVPPADDLVGRTINIDAQPGEGEGPPVFQTGVGPVSSVAPASVVPVSAPVPSPPASRTVVPTAPPAEVETVIRPLPKLDDTRIQATPSVPPLEPAEEGGAMWLWAGVVGGLLGLLFLIALFILGIIVALVVAA